MLKATQLGCPGPTLLLVLSKMSSQALWPNALVIKKMFFLLVASDLHYFPVCASTSPFLVIAASSALVCP